MLGVGRHGRLPAVGRCGRGPLRGPGCDPRDDDADVGREERDAWVVLVSAHGVGPVSFGALIAAFGTARAVLDAALGRDGQARLADTTRTADGRTVVDAVAARGVTDVARAPELALRAVRDAAVDVVTLADARYPARLRAIDLPPPVLFVRGSSEALDRPRSVAVVGTRRPTDAGRLTAGRIGEAVAALGATVVSGLAFGIDAAAHAAALRARGVTVAVIGGGHGRLYPAAHRALADLIVSGGGAVVSEFLPDTPPSRGTFPRRNRLISGLADATVVVEAGRRSGALTTAAWALEQGRALHLVPGRIDDPSVAGSLAFLREAANEARIVVGVPELLEDLGLIGHRLGDRGVDAHRAGRASLAAVLGTLGDVERDLAAAVATGASGLDELVVATGHAPATVLGALTALEMRGLVVDAFGRFAPSGPLLMASVDPGPSAR